MPGRGSREFVLRILSSAPDVKVRGWHFIPHDETSLSATICLLLMEKYYGISGKKLFNFSDGKVSPAYAYWESGPGLRQGRLPAVEVMPPARDRTESLCRYRPSELRFPRNRDAGSGLLVSPPTSSSRRVCCPVAADSPARLVAGLVLGEHLADPCQGGTSHVRGWRRN